MLICAGSVGPAWASSASPIGVWMTEERESRIKIAPCGKALCATVLWARTSGTDRNNPDPGLRNRNIIGIDLSRDFKSDGSGGWTGSIYNPQNGKTYKATLQVRSDRELEVGGCVLGGLLCGSETWSRESGGTTGSIAR